jgi:hypothetical protein
VSIYLYQFVRHNIAFNRKEPREREIGKTRRLTAFLVFAPWRLPIPWVNNLNSATFKIVNIAGRELSSSHLGQCCYLRIRMANQPAQDTRAAPILANTLAASLSKTKTRPAKSSLNIASAAANNLRDAYLGREAQFRKKFPLRLSRS